MIADHSTLSPGMVMPAVRTDVMTPLSVLGGQAPTRSHAIAHSFSSSDVLGTIFECTDFPALTIQEHEY